MPIKIILDNRQNLAEEHVANSPEVQYAVEVRILRMGGIVKGTRIGRRVVVEYHQTETQPKQTAVENGRRNLDSCSKEGSVCWEECGCKKAVKKAREKNRDLNS
jgi:hypothetical protein